MINQNKNDNAANRKSYVGKIYNRGEKEFKHDILNSIDPQCAKLHKEGYVHIHDLDAYGSTYNCLTFDIVNAFPYKDFESLEDEDKILGFYDWLKETFAKMGNEQSGGMALANADEEISYILEKQGIEYTKHKKLLKGCIRALVMWCNNIHTRMGQTSYYVTFNIGLGTSDFARFISEALLDSFYNAGELVYKPNIVFKVCGGINRYKEDKNYDLFTKALLCTAKKMIPTYLLCDCESDKDVDPHKLCIMGCRTRVVDDVFGKDGAIGRGNIVNTSINLPRIALDTVHSNVNSSIYIEEFKQRWLTIARIVKDQLIDRYYKTLNSDPSLFPTNSEYKLWCEDINKVGLAETLKHGTLSIGFIGLTETIEILTGKKFWKNAESYKIALDLVSFMRQYTDSLRDEYHLNFSLLATSGELISGRFVELDKKIYDSPVLQKGYYTNSFHVDVNSQLSAYEKLELEGPFHTLSNGGCISYIELSEAPFGNAEGLEELVEVAIKSGVHYLGFNFPKDVCNCCGSSGTFDACPKCGSKNITRIRRVSGYLEIQDFFTAGKMNESKNRMAN